MNPQAKSLSSLCIMYISLSVIGFVVEEGKYRSAGLHVRSARQTAMELDWIRSSAFSPGGLPSGQSQERCVVACSPQGSAFGKCHYEYWRSMVRINRPVRLLWIEVVRPQFAIVHRPDCQRPVCATIVLRTESDAKVVLADAPLPSSPPTIRAIAPMAYYLRTNDQSSWQDHRKLFGLTHRVCTRVSWMKHYIRGLDVCRQDIIRLYLRNGIRYNASSFWTPVLRTFDPAFAAWVISG
jgi:hypothetical protein